MVVLYLAERGDNYEYVRTILQNLGVEVKLIGAFRLEDAWRAFTEHQSESGLEMILVDINLGDILWLSRFIRRVSECSFTRPWMVTGGTPSQMAELRRSHPVLGFETSFQDLLVNVARRLHPEVESEEEPLPG